MRGGVDAIELGFLPPFVSFLDFVIKIKIHSSSEIDDFVETHIYLQAMCDTPIARITGCVSSLRIYKYRMTRGPGLGPYFVSGWNWHNDIYIYRNPIQLEISRSVALVFSTLTVRGGINAGGIPVSVPWLSEFYIREWIMVFGMDPVVSGQ